jgi:ABC-type antimicrobial peptide transport system permease subunit
MGRVVLAGSPGVNVEASLIWGPNAGDLQTIVCSTVIPLAAGTLAGFLPARRAASVEPTTALRSD